jgi:hypothetical protein
MGGSEHQLPCSALRLSARDRHGGWPRVRCCCARPTGTRPGPALQKSAAWRSSVLAAGAVGDCGTQGTTRRAAHRDSGECSGRVLTRPLSPSIVCSAAQTHNAHAACQVAPEQWLQRAVTGATCNTGCCWRAVRRLRKPRSKNTHAGARTPTRTHVRAHAQTHPHLYKHYTHARKQHTHMHPGRARGHRHA